MKRIFSLLLTIVLLLSASSAMAAKKKEKATPTPAPMAIQEEPAEAPEEIQRLVDVAYEEWTTVNGKDQGEKNKYTTWYNNYKWGRNTWCAGFVTWCMLEAGIPQITPDEVKEVEEGTSPSSIIHVKASSPGKMMPGYLRMHRISAIPQKGFIVLYGEGSNNHVHVGIVYDVERLPDGKYRLTCIEGAMKNTVKMFVFDYDASAEKKKNTSLVPKEEQTEEETKIFSYGRHVKGKKYYVNCFLMPWLPGEAAE